MTTDPVPATAAVPPDRQLVRELWPLLLAAALGLVPFTIMGNFLAPIAQDADSPVEVIGSFRGLGGIAALVLGATAAPLIDRIPRNKVAGIALATLAIACLGSLLSATAGWIAFCLLVGVGTSLLNPAVSAMAADRYSSEAASGRAATLVTSTTTLTAMLAAPLLAAPAVIWGWQGDMIGAALLCSVVALVLVRRPEKRPADRGPAPGYVEAFRTALRVPGAVLLIALSCVRTACFMGQLAYVAAYYDQVHDLSPTTFSLVWTLSGTAFFVGTWWSGRFLAQDRNLRLAPAVLSAGGALAAVGHTALFLTSSLPLALAGTALSSIGHALLAAGVITLLVRRAGEVRGTLMSLNGSGQSLGVFAGAALVGTTLALGGWRATGVTLALLMAGCAIAGQAIKPLPAKEHHVDR